MDLNQAYRIAEIISRQKSRTALPEEIHELEIWLKVSSENRDSYECIISGQGIARRIELERQIDTDRGYKHLIARLSRRHKWRRLKNYTTTAAIVLIGLTIALLWPGNNIEPERNIFTQDSVIRPGSTRAILILGNGSRVNLEKETDSLTIRGITLDRRKGTLTYHKQQLQGSPNEMNTLVVPLKGEYQLVLSDGTKIWLNAGSRLSYPTLFNGKQRLVELEGEAFFEVAHCADRPFIVKSEKLETRVLGTIFNLSVYKDERLGAITLVSGKVSVTVSGKSENILNSGQQLKYDKNNDGITIQQVNTEDAIAWKNGFFLFNNQGIDEITSHLKRWYGMNFYYNRQEFEDLKFYIRTRRYENIATIMNILKLTENITYTIEGNNVTIRRVFPGK